MTVDRVKLKITNERHREYRDAFDISIKRDYLKLICKFLADPTLSATNMDDMELFADLCFQSKFGRVHIELGRFLCDRALDDSLNERAVNNFIEYMTYLSPHHLDDFYLTIFKDFGSDFIPIFLKYLKANHRLQLAQFAAENYPRILLRLPKLKTYLIFS